MTTPAAMPRCLLGLRLLGLRLLAMILGCNTLLHSNTHACPSEFQAVSKILSQQCLDCHSADTQEGAVDLERFHAAEDIDTDRQLWKRLFDVVEARQMPLHGSGYELAPDDRQRLLSFTRDALARPDPRLQAIDPGKPVLRRLTRLEYNNTVRDLFGLQIDIFMFPERLPVADKRYFTGRLEIAAASVPDSSHGPGLGHVLETSMREYGQKYDVLLPQLGLPGDNRAEYGFSNRGDALNFSPLLFEKYVELAAAIASSERLLHESKVLQDLLGMEHPTNPATPANAGNTDSRISLSDQYAARERIGRMAEGNDTWHADFVRDLTAAFERGSGGTFDVPGSLNNQTVAGKGGLLKLSVNQRTLTINPNVDLWLASFATAEETSGELLLTNRKPGEKEFELTFDGEGDEQPEIEQLGICVLARRKQAGVVKLEAVLSNGLRIARSAAISEASGNVFVSWVAPPGTSITKLAIDGSEFSGDYVLLDDIGFIYRATFSSLAELTDSAEPAQPAAPEITPLHDLDSATTDTPSMGQQSVTPPRPLPERLKTFLSRAYRREVADEEVAAALSLIETQIASGHSEAAAIRQWLQIVLTSPEFLFIAEPMIESEAQVRELTAPELATRLSYFLWSSMPDDELQLLANSGALKQKDVLIEQLHRMLAKRTHSRELSESFAAQWLRLDQLYTSKPDPELFAPFYSGPQGKSTLHGAMMTEALLLFETVLIENRSVIELFDADFTWLNEQLAKLYGLEAEFRTALDSYNTQAGTAVSLPEKGGHRFWLRTPLPDRTRGGVMTMAGPLVLTSLPFRTSPIKRGAWLLETVFNRPPSEPKVAFVLEEASQPDEPADATASTAGVATATTVRQRFEQHRSDPNCYSCHSRIDPPGFSLEVFDAIGALRTHEGSQPVDASGEWNAHPFDGPATFKRALWIDKQEVLRGFVEHLLSYALGRQLEHYDMQTVDRIVQESATNDYRIDSILQGIVLSYPFQHVRNVE